MKAFAPSIEDTSWVERLREGHFIWLVKERCIGQVEIPFYPPEPGFISGKLGFKKFADADLGRHYYVGTEIWYMNFDGTGMDGSQLILPVEGNLPDFPDPIEEPVVRELRREIARLNAEIAQIKREMAIR